MAPETPRAFQYFQSELRNVVLGGYLNGRVTHGVWGLMLKSIGSKLIAMASSSSSPAAPPSNSAKEEPSPVKAEVKEEDVKMEGGDGIVGMVLFVLSLFWVCLGSGGAAQAPWRPRQEGAALALTGPLAQLRRSEAAEGAQALGAARRGPTSTGPRRQRHGW